MLITAERAIESATLKCENVSLKRKKHGSDVVLVGSSQSMIKVRTQALKAAASNSCVYISSPKGACAEDLAWLIHCNSSRKENRFLVYDCRHSDQETLGKELFGTSLKKGIIRSASGGTLFLDDVFRMNEANQKQLLDFMRTRHIDNVEMDTRIICNSYSGTDNAISELYERLSGIEIILKPLIERMSDISEIIEYYYNNSFNIFGVVNPPKLSDDAKEALVNYSWPGNVTQLKNVLENLFLVTEKDWIELSDLPAEISGNKIEATGDNITAYTNVPLREARDSFERDYLLYQLRRFDNNVTSIAKHIEMDRSALYKKMKGLNILVDEQKLESI